MTYLELLQLTHDFKHGFITFDEFKSKLIDRTTKEFMDRKYIEDVAEINKRLCNFKNNGD